MKVCVRKEIEVKKIRASMNVRYWEDATSLSNTLSRTTAQKMVQ